jgi:hypothetical protein
MDKILKLEFNGRRKLSPSRKKTYYVVGIIEILIGTLGLINSNYEINLFYLILLIGGILSVIWGLNGQYLIKEKNSISLSKEEIEFKNSFKKSKRIKIKDLLDIRTESGKVEFVLSDQRVKSYDFTVFQEQKLDNIYRELERVKANLVKTNAWG